MKKAISIWALQGHEDRPAAELFREARDAGFDGIEPAVGAKGLLTPESTREDCRRLLDVAAQTGIQITSVASGLGWTYSLSADDPGTRLKGIGVYRGALRVTGWLGVEALLVVPGRVHATFCDAPGVHVPYDVCWKRATSSIRSLVPAADRARATLCVENVWNMFLLSPLEMKTFIEQFGSRRVGCYFDTGNAVATGFPEDWVRLLGRRIRSVHFKDFKRSVGTLDGFCDLLDGDVDFAAVMAELRAVRYEGPCVAEFFNLSKPRLRKLSKRMDRILSL